MFFSKSFFEYAFFLYGIERTLFWNFHSKIKKFFIPRVEWERHLLSKKNSFLLFDSLIYIFNLKITLFSSKKPIHPISISVFFHHIKCIKKIHQ